MKKNFLSKIGILTFSALLFTAVLTPVTGLAAGGPNNSQGIRAYQTAAAATTQTLTDEEASILKEALAEERLAVATYQAIIDKYGELLPFVNILKAEESHVDALERVMTVYGVDTTTDPVNVTVPDTLEEALAAAIALEKEDIAIYEKYISQIDVQQIQIVFSRLEKASESHLWALENSQDIPLGQAMANRYGASSDQQPGFGPQNGNGAPQGFGPSNGQMNTGRQGSQSYGPRQQMNDCPLGTGPQRTPRSGR